MQNRNLAKEIFTRKHDIASSRTRYKQLPVVASSSSIVENVFKVFSSFSTDKEVSIMTATFSLDESYHVTHTSDDEKSCTHV
jgi:hypothetical protein